MMKTLTRFGVKMVISVQLANLTLRFAMRTRSKSRSHQLEPKTLSNPTLTITLVTSQYGNIRVSKSVRWLFQYESYLTVEHAIDIWCCVYCTLDTMPQFTDCYIRASSLSFCLIIMCFSPHPISLFISITSWPYSNHEIQWSGVGVLVRIHLPLKCITGHA